jgi:hypothetical protein
MQATSVTDIPESELARWLFSHPVASRDIFRTLGLGDCSCIDFGRSPKDFDSDARGPGDIDVLLCPKPSPDRAVAIELKRVKIVPETFYTEQPGKLGDLKHGVQQANLLYSLGFYRTILMVAIVTDGRDRAGSNFASRGPTSTLANLIDQFPHNDRLGSGIGLTFVEITQPIDKEISWAGAVVVRSACDTEPRLQAAALTARVSTVLCDG